MLENTPPKKETEESNLVFGLMPNAQFLEFCRNYFLDKPNIFNNTEDLNLKKIIDEAEKRGIGMNILQLYLPSTTLGIESTSVLDHLPKQEFGGDFVL